MSRFKIGDRVYEAASLDKVSLKDLVTFKRQTAELGLDVAFSDVEALAALSKDELENHPDKYLVMGVMVWAARRSAGEDVTLEQAIDFPLADMTWLPEPEDHKPGEAKRPTSRTRKDSDPAAAADEPAE